VARAINQAQPEYRVVFPEEAIGDPASEQREKIYADDKRMENVFCRGTAFRLGQMQQQRRDEEHREDVAHPIKAEPLAALVRDDVRNLTGDARLRRRRVGTHGVLGHRIRESTLSRR
jgi:hypothetical protein